jgi:hypothetical protein
MARWRLPSFAGPEFAEPWVAVLTALRGPVGTFLAGVGQRAPRGPCSGAPVVKGAGQTGGTLAIDGATPDLAMWVRAGDWFQLGSGATASVRKVLVDAGSDGGGNVTLEVWPPFGTAPEDDAPLTFLNPVGRWRLTGQPHWRISAGKIYAVEFVGSWQP